MRWSSSSTVVLCLLSALGSAALAQTTIDPKTTVEQCAKVVDPAVRKECVACVSQGRRIFYPNAQGTARCAEAKADGPQREPLSGRSC